MSVGKGKKIRRFYPTINKKNTLLVSVLFILFPLPMILVVYYLGAVKSIENAIFYILVMDLVFAISAPFIMFIIFYLKSVAIYSNGILSFNPLNNRENFMAWGAMKTIDCQKKNDKEYYMV